MIHCTALMSAPDSLLLSNLLRQRVPKQRYNNRLTQEEKVAPSANNSEYGKSLTLGVRLDLAGDVVGVGVDSELLLQFIT
jgi:hypothetical protein